MSSSQSSWSSSDLERLGPFAHFRDVPVPVEVMLGVGSIALRNLLALSPGSVVRLQSSAGGDLQIAVKGVRVAMGEVVIIEETIAVRVTHIASAGGEALS
jgi:flagellar motor switch protein FliN/FliY